MDLRPDPFPEPAHGENVAREPQDRVLFDVMVTPHRSLGPTGFVILMAVVGLIGFAAGTAFMIMGAWPVMGFFGLDVALIYGAFRLNYRAGRAAEHIRLTRDALVIRRSDPGGCVREVRLPPGWLRIENPGAGHYKALRLTTHGQSHPVGAWLTDEERMALADALQDALDHLRRPHFPSDAAIVD